MKLFQELFVNANNVITRDAETSELHLKCVGKVVYFIRSHSVRCMRYATFYCTFYDSYEYI